MSTVTVLPRNIVVHARPTGLVASVVDEVELGFEQQRGKVDLPHVILLLLLVACYISNVLCHNKDGDNISLMMILAIMI